MRVPVLLAVIGTAGLLSAGAVAGYVAWKNPAYAEVVSVEPVKQVISTPEKICTKEQVGPRVPVQDQPDYLAENPGLGGRVISGMGRQPVGTRTGGKVFSGTGTTVGAQPVRDTHSARPQKKKPEKDAYAVTITHCRTLTQVSERVVAYDVRYRLQGKTSKIRMDHNPGRRIPVRDGKLVLRNDVANGSGFRG
jgi:uncharacterized protein YcfJ